MSKTTRYVAALAAMAMILAGGAAIHGDGYLLNAAQKTLQRGSVKAGTHDHLLFPVRSVASATPQPWPLHPHYNRQPLSANMERVLDQTEALAFIVVKDGQLLQERYFRGHGRGAVSNSFSMAKPIVGLLLGFAASEAKIRSLQQPVSAYLEGYDEGVAAKLKIVDLIRMTSGMAWDDPEVYNRPLSRTAQLYYVDDLRKFMARQAIATEPGARFHYNSGNTALAAQLLQKATGVSVSQYLSERLWRPLGMEHDAYWMLDRPDGMEKAFCCLSATARDFARLGQFVLQKGNWNGTQLLPSSFIEEALSPSSPHYGYGFRMDNQHAPAFSLFRGIGGQLIIMVPQHNAVIVKLGKTALPDDPTVPLVRAPETYTLVNEVVSGFASVAK